MARQSKKEPAFKKTWEQWFNEFIFFKQAQGRSNTTLNDYRFHIKLFFNRHESAWQDADSLKQAVYQHLAEASDKADATFNLRREYLHGFFSWMVDEGRLLNNPISAIPKKKDTGKVRCINEEVLIKMLALPDKKTFVGLRDYGLMLLMLDTGVRPKEALSLLQEDLNLNSYEITIKPANDKTRTGRTLPITPKTANILMKLISCRPNEWQENIPIFCSCEGNQMDRKAWANLILGHSNN